MEASPGCNAALAAAALALLGGAAGCGAKTGLGAPSPEGGVEGRDGGVVDGLDGEVGPEAGIPDAGPDAPDVVTPACSGADLVVRYDEAGRPSPERVELSATVRIPQADVYFLLDTTGSMTGEIRAMRRAVIELIDTLTCPAGGARCSTDADCAMGEVCSPEGRCGPAPEVGGCLPDLHVGVGRYAGDTDTYRHLLDVAPPSMETVGAIPAVADGPGGGETLYQSVSCVVGMGRRCPSAECARDGRGCGGFRERALPILVTITDEGDECRFGECGTTPEMAGGALRRFGAVFVGIDADVEGEATPFLEALAVESGSLDADGAPLVFSGSEGDVVDAVRDGLGTVATSPLRLHVQLDEVEGDDGDALGYVEAVEVNTSSPSCFPYSDLRDTDGDGRPDEVPAAGPGTTGCFDVIPRELGERPPGSDVLELRLRARLLGDGAVVDERTICIAAPAS